MADSQPLETKLSEMRAGSRERMPQEMLDQIAKMVSGLEATVIPKAVAVGEVAPDFTLRNAVTDETVTLSGALKDGPVVLSFYRGDWCPFCNAELHALGQVHPDILALGAKLFYIGPETRDHAQSMVDANSTDVPLLYDEDGAVQDAYRITFQLPEPFKPMYQQYFDFPNRNASTEWKLPVPATYVVGTDGVVAFRHANAHYQYRMEPAEILTELKKLDGVAAKS